MTPPPAARGGPNTALLAVGSAACAAAGFGAVWWLGVGRPGPTDVPAAAPHVAVARHAEPGATGAPQPPRFFVPAGDGEAGEPRPAATRPAEATSRFGAQPASLEDDSPEATSANASSNEAGPDATGSRFSRFHELPAEEPVESPSRDSGEPAAAEPADPAEVGNPAATEQPSARHDVPEASENASTAVPPSRPVSDGSVLAPEQPAEQPAEPAGQAVFATPPGQDRAASTPEEAVVTPATDVRPPALRSPPLESTFAAALAPLQQQAPPATAPAARAAPPEGDAAAFDDPEAPIPVTLPGGVPAGQAGGPPAGGSFPAPVGPGSPVAGDALPPRPAVDRFAARDVTGKPAFGGASPFRVAPSEAPAGAAAAPVTPPPDAAAAALSTAAGLGPLSADGRPGPVHLEGVQTPQLTLEKRGPREVQVGKTARYDMLVRNVGSAVAHDVTLRDRIPLGSKLLATSPPAAPGAGGELVWSLGSLPQGGTARVAMEVVPVEEGEMGSVASVSFRADATMRSVATKAALAIDVEPPKPVLVGSGIDLAITVRNPGTGEATGVVLEGLLPEGFKHASGPEIEFDVGKLRPGESRRVELRLLTTHPGVQSLPLSARADGRIETTQSVRLEVTAPTLELTARMPNRRYLQRPATCILSMANAGTAPAKSIELAAQLPPGMKFVRANNAGYYEEATHRVLWHLEELPASEIGSVEMVLVPTDLGPQRIAAAARSTDGLTAQAVHTVEVEGLAAVLFEVGDSEDPIEVDGITEYVVRVGNQGTKPATGVRVTATLLGDLEPVEAKGPVAHRVENLTILFDPLAKLAPAEESVYRIRVRGRREGDQRVQVQVTSDDSQAPITKEEVTRVYADR